LNFHKDFNENHISFFKNVIYIYTYIYMLSKDVCIIIINIIIENNVIRIKQILLMK